MGTTSNHHRLCLSITVLLMLTLACGLLPSDDPEIAAKTAFEKWAQQAGVPYKNVVYQTIHNDGTFATVRLQATLKESPIEDWLDKTADIECRHVKSEWQCSSTFVLQAQITSSTATALAPWPTLTPPSTLIKVGLVTDVSGVNDRSFNQSAWVGVQRGAQEFGVDVKFIESKQPTAYERNIDRFATEKYDVIITVGLLMGDATAAKGVQYPNIKFVIIDNAYFPNKGAKPCDETKKNCYVDGELTNITSLMFQGRPGRLPGRCVGRGDEQDRHGLHGLRHGNSTCAALCDRLPEWRQVDEGRYQDAERLRSVVH